MSETGKPADDQREGTLVSHLIELRGRLIKMGAAVLVVFIVLAPFARKVFTLIATPLIEKLPEGSSMIATQVASPFLAPFKLTLFVAFFLAAPVWLYQLWAFIAPGLYKQEKRLAFPLVLTSIALFYLGTAFAYYVVFPVIFGFFTSVAPEGVTVMTDINQYLDFVLKLFFAFGAAFEVPIATILLVWAGITTPAKLGKARPYVFLGAFVIGMLLTPPDAVSQTLLALPAYILFELGIALSRWLVPGHKEVEAQAAEISKGVSE